MSPKKKRKTKKDRSPARKATSEQDAGEDLSGDEEMEVEAEPSPSKKCMQNSMQLIIGGVVHCRGCNDPCQKKCGNWAASHRDEKTGTMVPDGVVCGNCLEFVEETPMTVDSFVKVMAHGPRALKEKVAADMESFAENQTKSVAERRKEFSGEPEVFVDTIFTATVRETGELVARSKFHDKNKVYPDDCGLTQLKFKNGRQQEVCIFLSWFGGGLLKNGRVGRSLAKASHGRPGYAKAGQGWPWLAMPSQGWP